MDGERAESGQNTQNVVRLSDRYRHSGQMAATVMMRLAPVFGHAPQYCERREIVARINWLLPAEAATGVLSPGNTTRRKFGAEKSTQNLRLRCRC